jgi:phosphotriesterase-related protein
MLPYLKDVRQHGINGFVDCTPAWIGRDALVLYKLSVLSDLHILTNTGYYGAADDKFVPLSAFMLSTEQLASIWVDEWLHGIDNTGIRPGFIKIGIDKGPLSEIDCKLAGAAAITHLKTGLIIACHVNDSQGALAVVKEIGVYGVSPSSLIIVHADGIADANTHYQLAKEGTWVEYDGITETSIEKHVQMIKSMLKAGFGNCLLLSHDGGWYQVGEENSKKEKRSYTIIYEKLIPALKAAGISDANISKLLIENPANAFTIKVRKL